MMTVMVSYNPLFLKRWAELYVEQYIQKSPQSAKMWALRTLDSRIMKECRPYIKREFLRAGYKMDE